MTFAFYLCNPQKNVSPSKQKVTPIRLVISHRGKKYYRFIGISVKPHEFVKQRTKDPKINDMLRRIEVVLIERLGQLSSEREILEAIDVALSPAGNTKSNPVKNIRPSFWEYFRAWGERPSPVQRQRRLYPNIVSRLMGEREDWEDIDSAYYYRLCRKMDDYGYSINTKGVCSN